MGYGLYNGWVKQIVRERELNKSPDLLHEKVDKMYIQGLFLKQQWDLDLPSFYRGLINSLRPSYIKSGYSPHCIRISMYLTIRLGAQNFYHMIVDKENMAVKITA